jgi:hypothetical protein
MFTAALQPRRGRNPNIHQKMNKENAVFTYNGQPLKANSYDMRHHR